MKIRELSENNLKYIDSQPYVPVLVDSDDTPRTVTNENYDYAIINGQYMSVRLSRLEISIEKLKIHDKRNMEVYNSFTIDNDYFHHTWNYDERIVTPYEYAMLSKIYVPPLPPVKTIEGIAAGAGTGSGSKRKTAAKSPTSTSHDFLLCNETFEENTPPQPRRMKVFSVNYKAPASVSSPSCAPAPTTPKPTIAKRRYNKYVVKKQRRRK
jgi:hypothetical protein